MILKLQIEKAARALGLAAKVELADITTANALARDADIIVTSDELAGRIGKVKAKIITIKNYMSLPEMTEKLKQATSS